jgi:carboxylesterase type B
MDAAQYFYVVGREDCLYLNVYTPKVIYIEVFLLDSMK